MSTSGDFVLRTSTASRAATLSLGRRLGELCDGGELLLLLGELGAGKTVFAKGVAAGLGIDPADVTSPTFLLVHELEGRLRLFHLDAYRIRDPGELTDLGFDEMLDAGGVVLLEWPERAKAILPPDNLAIRFDFAFEGERDITFAARGSAHERLLRRLAEQIEPEAIRP